LSDRITPSDSLCRAAAQSRLHSTHKPHNVFLPSLHHKSHGFLSYPSPTSIFDPTAQWAVPIDRLYTIIIIDPSAVIIIVGAEYGRRQCQGDSGDGIVARFGQEYRFGFGPARTKGCHQLRIGRIQGGRRSDRQ
jgi:hypothetical protein